MLGARLRRDHERDGIEQHRRRCLERPLGRDPAAVLRLHAADGRSDQLHGRTDIVELRFELPQEAVVDAVRYERAEPAAAERWPPAAHDAQRGRRRQVGACRHDARCRRRQRIEAQALCDVHRELVVDVEEMRDDARSNLGCFDLAQLENERRGDVLPLQRRLADVELASLIVVIGEALRSSTTAWCRAGPRHTTRSRSAASPGARPASQELGS